jgi:hypothetical protein
MARPKIPFHQPSQLDTNFNEAAAQHIGIEPNAHPEFAPDAPRAPIKSPIGLGTAVSNSFRAIKQGLGIQAPDVGPIEEQINQRKAINRGYQILKGNK